MARITIHLPGAVASRVRENARANGKSVSRWVREMVVRNVGDSWPDAVLKAAGSMPDFPSLNEIRKGFGNDVPRVPVD
jgi:hypothetical protein